MGASGSCFNYVEPFKQPDSNSCFPTALAILNRAYAARVGLGYASSGPLDSLAKADVMSLLKPAPPRLNDVVERTLAYPLMSTEEADGLAESNGFASQYLDLYPEAISSLLRTGHPFAFVALYRPNPSYKHTLVVSGIRFRSFGADLIYVDPAVGKQGTSEWAAFFTAHPPTDTKATQGTGLAVARVYYKP